MISSLDKKIIHRFQGDIPIMEDPYSSIAEELGISEDELLERLKILNKEGILKRLGAILYHNEVGFKVNAMVVWKAPKETVETIGRIIASVPEVSHCYERATNNFWKYNLYSMIHVKTKEQCVKIVNDIVYKTGIKDYKILYSVKELKKTSMKYF